MITLAAVRDWLKTRIDCPQWYIGKIDGKKPQCIGLYNATGAPPVLAVGGVDKTGYAVKSVSILVHWGNNADKAEQKAQEVYAALLGQTAVIGGKPVAMFSMRSGEPINVGTDSEGIYEYVIETSIYYER